MSKLEEIFFGNCNYLKNFIWVLVFLLWQVVEFSKTRSVSLLFYKNVYFAVGNAEWQE